MWGDRPLNLNIITNVSVFATFLFYKSKQIFLSLEIKETTSFRGQPNNSLMVVAKTKIACCLG